MFSGLSKISCRTDLVYKWSIVLDFRTKFSFKTEQLFSHINHNWTTQNYHLFTLPLSSVIGVLYICMNCISLLLSNCVFAPRSTCFVSVSLFILPFCLCLSIKIDIIFSYLQGKVFWNWDQQSQEIYRGNKCSELNVITDRRTKLSVDEALHRKKNSDV